MSTIPTAAAPAGAAADTAEQAEFRAEVRAFLEAHCEPRKAADPWALNFHTSPDEARAHFEKGRRWQALLWEHRLAGLTYPTEYGGRGGTDWHERIFAEESAAFETHRGFVAATIAMLGPTLMKHGTEEQKAYYLPRMLSAEDAWCQLFSEPGAGSDLASLACRAVRDGDEFVVTGQKVWNSAAQWCDKGFLLVRTNPDAPKHAGITFLLVDMDWPGIEVRPLVQATGGAHFNEVFLQDVRVPVDRVVGEIDGGWGPARTVMSNESAFIGGFSGGSTHDKLVMLAEAHGRLADPMVREGLTRHYVRERVLSMMSGRIMAAVHRRQAPPVDPSILKLYVAENRALSGDLAMAIGGAAVMAGDGPMARWAQAEAINRYSSSIGGGTNEVQRNNLAERALGLPREPGIPKDTPWKDIPRS